jgi:hypothetical protein
MFATPAGEYGYGRQHMTELWFVYEGAKPMRGYPAYDLPTKELIGKLGGEARFKWIGRLDDKLTFEEKALGQIAGIQHVVLKLEEAAAKRLRWRPGLYLVSRSPLEVTEILGAPLEPSETL